MSLQLLFGGQFVLIKKDDTQSPVARFFFFSIFFHFFHFFFLFFFFFFSFFFSISIFLCVKRLKKKCILDLVGVLVLRVMLLWLAPLLKLKKMLLMDWYFFFFDSHFFF